MGAVKRILVTGAGAPGGPGIIQSLKSVCAYAVYGADIDSHASGRFLVDEFFQIPRPNENGFIGTLLEICLKKKIDVVVPLVTKELFVLSESTDLFAEHGIKVVVSENRALTIANDKAGLYDQLAGTSVCLPDYLVVSSKSELLKAVEAIGYPSKPVVIKPARGNGSRGIRIVNSQKSRFDLLFNEKPSSLYCSLDDYLDAIGDNAIPQLVVSEYLPGGEVTVDSLVFNGKAEVILIRQRDAMREGISVAGHFIECQDVEEQVRTIVSTIPGLEGPIGFQFKMSDSGRYGLLESNPRLQGTSVAAQGLGYNFPHQAVQACLSGSIDTPQRTKNVGFKRYYKEVFFEL